MSQSPPNRRISSRAFTLIEVLVSMAILSFIVMILASVLGQSSRVWQQGVSDTQHRQRARAALEFISQDLKKATLPLDRTKQNSLRFEINPASSPGSGDSIFFQAPIATDSSMGILAEVGYFVQWTGTKASLYRLFLNPSDTAYVVSPNPNDVSAGITNWSPFLFLEDVIGMWVNAYDKDGTLLTLPFDSRVSKTLPATVEISLVMLDAAHAQRLAATPTSASTAASFVDSLPASVRPGATIVSIKVNLENMTGW